jgi:hypothetical protein
LTGWAGVVGVGEVVDVTGAVVVVVNNISEVEVVRAVEVVVGNLCVVDVLCSFVVMGTTHRSETRVNP